MKRALPFLSFALLLLATAATAHTVPGDAIASAEISATETVQAGDAVANARIDDMLIHALSLIGVKYRFGGNNADNGFDCSGFVHHVFAESLALNLPRSSFAMSKLGVAVDKDALRPGDLLFYNTLRRHFSHVAIYLGEGRFVHSPSRGKSVEIVDMADAYWKKRFNGARRFIEDK